MRLIILLIAVIFVGFLLEKQFNTNNSDSNIETYSGITKDGAVAAPKSQKDIQKLRKDLNGLLQDSADRQSKSIEQSLNK